MKSLSLPLALSAIALVATNAAADLPRKDSTEFDYKYEMNALPTAEDFDHDGVVDFTDNKPGDNWISLLNGYAIFDCSQQNRYIGSAAAAGAAGGAWQRAGITAQTGFTVETRLRVTSEFNGIKYSFCVQASPNSSVHACLNFTTNKVMWGDTVLTNMDTQAFFHTYRIAQAPGTSKYSVWCDGILLAENLGTGLSYGPALNRLLVGSIGSNWKGAARVTYLRFTKGGYAPERTRKESSEFAHRYEMDSTDTRFSPTATTADWTHKEGAEGSSRLTNGKLSVVQPKGKMRYWQTTGPLDSSITNSSPFTLEMKVRAYDPWNASLPVLNVLCGTPRAAGSFFVGADTVCWFDRLNVIWRGDNTDKAHVFRLTYEGDTELAFSLWRDGEKIGENLVRFNSGDTYTFNYLRFGIVSTATHGGSFDVDYIRWDTTGAYDWKDPPAAFVVVVR